MPRILNTSPWECRINIITAVHEPSAAFYATSNLYGGVNVRGPNRSSEPITTIIHKGHGLRIVLHPHQRRHWPKCFFCHHSHSMVNIRKHLGRQIRSASPTIGEERSIHQRPRSLANCLFHLYTNGGRSPLVDHSA